MSDANLDLIGFLALAYLLLLYKTYRKKMVLDQTLLLFAAYSLLVLFTFNPLYKYYLVGVAPLLVLVAPDERGLTVFISLNLVLMLIPRIVGSYVPLAVLLWLTFRARSGAGGRA